MPDITRLDGSRPAETDVDAVDPSRVEGTGAACGPLPSALAEVEPELEMLQLFEEVASVNKHAVVTDRVRVSTRTETVDEVVRETLESQTVEIERIEFNRLLALGEPAPQIRTEGEVTIIPIVEEVLVSEKRLRLKEELRVIRRVNAGVFEETVPLRRQVANIEHLDPKPTTGE